MKFLINISNTRLSWASYSSASSSTNETDGDIGTLKPFSFDPDITDEGSVSTSNISGNSEEEDENLRIGNNTWCPCDHCKLMQTSVESLSCKNTSEVLDENFDGRVLYYFIPLPSIPIK